MSTGTTAKPRGNYVTEPQTVGLPAVENALMALWKHHDLPEGTARGILTRACMSNLVIVCQGRDEAAKLTEEVDVVVSRHPSRVILLVIDKDDQSAGSPIRAEVTAHCHTSGDKFAPRWWPSPPASTRPVCSPRRRGRCWSATCRRPSGGTVLSRPPSPARSSTS